jgi:hypothetical protein
VLWAVGAVLALVIVLALWRRALAPLGRATGLIAAAALAGGVAAAPVTAWRIVEAVRYSTSLPAPVARDWPDYHNYLEPKVYQELRRVIAAGETYAVAVAPDIEPLAARAAFTGWPLATLLPRRAVADPREADWLVTWGVDPRTLSSVHARSVRMLPSRYPGRPVFIARLS